MVSVVIPVLNREDTIERCLDSIVRQSYADLDIIIIDDGSTDKTCEICAGYVNRDERIRLLTGSKTGVATARNLGIENAKGEYLTFIDSDDFVDPDYIRLLFESVDGQDFIMSVCNYCEVRGNKRENRVLYNKSEVCTADYIDDFLYNRVQGGLCWGKLYRHDILKTMFEDFSYCEDVLFVFNYLSDNPGIVKIVSKPLYYYYRHENSITGSRKAVYLKDSVSVAENIIKICEERITEHLPAAYSFMADVSHFSYLQISKEKSEEAELLKKSIKKNLSLTRAVVLRNKNAGIKTKGACIASAISYRLLTFLYGFISR